MNLPEKINKGIQLFHSHKNGVKAIEIRRAISDVPAVAAALDRVEKYVFVASTKTQICEMEKDAYIRQAKILLQGIAMDVGYSITNVEEWSMRCARLIDWLYNYHSLLTLAELKLCFELSVTGELDEYLPVGKNGEPDRAHYQQFNIDFFSKIINAYKKKQGKTIQKAYSAIPPPKANNKKLIKYFWFRIVDRIFYTFLCYKYFGRIEFEKSDEMYCYELLNSWGLVYPVNVTQEDKDQAFQEFKSKHLSARPNPYELDKILNDGSDSEKLYHSAYKIARAREIKETFDWMIEEEFHIFDLLK